MSYTKKKVEDHNWLIEYTGEDAIADATLLDVEMNQLSSLAFDDGSVTVNLDDYGDGVYIVQIIHASILIAFITIEDYSDAYLCYKALFKYKMCKCCDPCDDCDEDMRARTEDMNSIITLVETLKEIVNLEDSQNKGVYTMTQSRMSMADELNMMIEKLHIITDRCGLCDALDTNLIEC